ncbi:MAG: M42 family peptidase [Chloroflexia bacterium]|nr:M42 family peptidase [Chloroflexia bacterium]
MFALVKELSEIPGPIGHEDPVQDWVSTNWATFCESVRRTRVDNVLAKVGGSGKKLVLVAHADEICFMVKSISDDGFLYIWPYYSDTVKRPPAWLSATGQPALVVSSDGLTDGVFATASGHVAGGRAGGKDHAEWNDWFIDIGVSSRAEAEALGIGAGSRVIWNPPTRRIGRNITGKAMDDRAALAIASEAGRRLAGRDDLAYEVWLASTIQEENGLLGAASLQDEETFDLGIALDVGLTGDIPGVDVRDFPCKLGSGPIVVYQDVTGQYSRRFSDRLLATARRIDVPVQRAVFQNYGSDGASLIRRGVECALLTYPTRYTHSPIETVNEDDLEAAVAMLVAFATEGHP